MRLGIYRLRDWFLLGPLFVVALALGVIGFEHCASADCQVSSLGAAVVRTLLLIRPSQNFSFDQDPWQLVIAQFLMFAVLLLAGLMGSVKLFVHNLRHDVHLARAHAMRGHVVVCGLGETGLEIVRGLRRAGEGVVAVTREETSEAVSSCERMGVPMLSGDASRVETLDHAGVRRARALVATTGSDAVNLDIAAAAASHAAGRAVPLVIRPEIRAPWLIDAIAAPREAIFDASLLVHPLRVQEVAARLLLGRASFTRNPGPQPRLLLAGLGDLGTAILHHAAFCTFALPGMKASVICYDDKAAAREAAVRAAPWRKFLDLEIRPACFGPTEDPTRAADWDAIRAELEKHPPDAVIVALGDDNAALEAAFGLRDALDRLHCFATPLHVRTRRAEGLRQLLSRMAERPLCPHRLAGFGDLGSLIAPEQLFDEAADRMARAVHAIYLAGARESDAPAAVPWERLAERFRRSNRASADHLPVKLAFAGLRLAPGPGPGVTLSEAEIERLAEAEHFRWSRVLEAEGWQGGPRDEAAKTHPLLVPWQALPEQVRADNRARTADIPRIAAEVGQVVRRLVPADPAAAAPDAGEIALLVLDVRDMSAWRAAEALAAQAPIVIHARELAQASVDDLSDLARDFPRAAASVEAWIEPAG